jgi:serine/threonine protein kinase
LDREASRLEASSSRYDRLSRVAMLLGGRKDENLAKKSKSLLQKSREAAEAATGEKVRLKSLENQSTAIESSTGGSRVGGNTGKLRYSAECSELFQVKKKIGKGAFGSVYIASRVDEWRMSGEPEYALKLITKGDADEQMDVRQEEVLNVLLRVDSLGCIAAW